MKHHHIRKVNSCADPLQSPHATPEAFLRRLKELVMAEWREEKAAFESGSKHKRGFGPMRLQGRDYNLAGEPLFLLNAPQGLTPERLFSPGESVLLRPFVGEAEPCLASVYQVEDLRIVLSTRRRYPDWIDDAESFRLTIHPGEITFRRMLDMMDQLGHPDTQRLEQLLEVATGTRNPRYDDFSFRELEFFNPALNEGQREAVRCALRAQDFAVIQGPPGTGKSTVICEIVRQALRQDASILVCAPSNAATDHLLHLLVEQGIRAARIGHMAKTDVNMHAHVLNVQLAQHPLNRELQARFRDLDKLHKQRKEGKFSGGFGAFKAQREQLKAEARLLREQIQERVFNNIDVFVGTLSACFHWAMRERHFDCVIIDEAAQAVEPMAWMPLRHAEKVILVGDANQLPPTLLSQEAVQGGLGVSLLERLQAVLPEPVNTRLKQQYRMHADIMHFSSQIFYDNILLADDSVSARTLADVVGEGVLPQPVRPLWYIDTAGKGYEEQTESGSTSRLNPEEGAIVKTLLERFLAMGVPAAAIGLISPYSAQVRWLNKHCARPGLEIDSIDGFQGREKEVILVSLVRSNLEGELGFLNDTRRMNVALTRARCQLVVVGDSATLASLDFYKRFIEYCESIGAYQSVWELEVVN